MDKEFYMAKALEQAQKAAAEDEVPVGAVVVDPKTGEIIAAAYNLSEHSADALAHAEMLAMRQACTKLHSNRLREMDLYVTLEPCTMCAAAISFMRIKHLYFGASDQKGGAVINGVRFFDSSSCHHKPQVENGIMDSECSKILKSFFAAKRRQAHDDKNS